MFIQPCRFVSIFVWFEIQNPIFVKIEQDSKYVLYFYYPVLFFIIIILGRFMADFGASMVVMGLDITGSGYKEVLFSY
ncbi:MAG: hypothetical protein K1W24_04755 [Lachnospiraceae bacterium]